MWFIGGLTVCLVTLLLFGFIYLAGAIQVNSTTYMYLLNLVFLTVSFLQISSFVVPKEQNDDAELHTTMSDTTANKAA
jgi:hypothetical protein